MIDRKRHFRINIRGIDISYLYIRKNACSAWKQVFINESRHDYDPKQYDNPIQFMGDFHLVGEKKAKEAKHRIVVVREPIGRIVSAFINQFVHRLERQTSFHKGVSDFLGCNVEDVTFKQFIEEYLARISASQLDSHFWSQKSHLGDVDYNRVMLLDNLYSDTKSLFGRLFADKYFKKKINSTSKLKRYETEAYSLSAKEIYDRFQKDRSWPSINSFLKDENLLKKLSALYQDDIELYESQLKGKIGMLVWNNFLHDSRVLKEAETLQKAGYQVIVHALLEKNKTNAFEILASGVKVIRVSQKFVNFNNSSALPISPLRQLFRLSSRMVALFRMLKMVIKSKPNVLHAHDVNVLPIAWLASKFVKVPFVYDAHEISTSREGYKSFRKIVGWLEKTLMPQSAANITTTDTRAKFFARAYGIIRPTVLQNRPSRYRPINSNRLRQELQLLEDWPIILYQGGLQSGRGLKKLIKSAVYVENAYFVLLGGGSQLQELLELAKSLNVCDRVKFVPTVSLSELPQYTSSADIGVQPIENTCLNHYSTDSNKLFEYVLAGLPIVATDLPEIRKIVNKYKLGELIAPDSVDALVLALNKLVSDGSYRKELIQNTLNARLDLTWEKQEQKLIDAYQFLDN